MVKRVVSLVIFAFLFLLFFNFGFRDYLRADELPWKPLAEVEEKPEDILKTLPKNLPQWDGLYIATPDEYIYLDPDKGRSGLVGDYPYWIYIGKEIYQMPIEKFKGILVVGKEYQQPVDIRIRIHPGENCTEYNYHGLTVECRHTKTTYLTFTRGKRERINPYVFVILLSEKEKYKLLKEVNCSLDSRGSCFFLVSILIDKPNPPEERRYTWLIKVTR
ncbi:MAG: hypothetical protein ACP5HC_02375 [Caldisericum sp.]